MTTSKVNRPTVTFTHNGVEYTVRKKFTADATEALENGRSVGFTKAQLGLKQYQKFVKSLDEEPDIDDVDDLVKSMLDAMDADKGKSKD